MSQKIYTDLIVKGGVTLAATNAGTDTDKFLVQDTNGTIRYRTGAEVLADIGAVTYSEVPSGVINGVNLEYTLTNTPANMEAVLVVLDGVTQYNGIDFIVVGNKISFYEPPALGSTIFVYYNISTGAANSNNLNNSIAMSIALG